MIVKGAQLNSINNTNLTIKKASLDLVNLGKTLDFSSILGEVMAAANGAVTSQQLEREKKKRVDISNVNNSLGINGDNNVLAQVQNVAPGVLGAAANANIEQVNKVPLQLFLDKTIESLDLLSKQEFRVNDLMEGFVEGRVSEDEVVVETAKLNLSMQMVTTIVQSAVQSFKEILQIAV